MKQMFADIFANPASASKFWGAFSTVALFGVKQWTGLDLGAIADPIVDVLILAVNPVLVYWLTNRPAQ